MNEVDFSQLEWFKSSRSSANGQCTMCARLPGGGMADVYWQGRKAGTAVPQVIGRHAHPKAPPDEDDPAPAALTGIDYLQLVADADTAALGGQLHLAALEDSAQEQE